MLDSALRLFAAAHALSALTSFGSAALTSSFGLFMCDSEQDNELINSAIDHVYHNDIVFIINIEKTL